MCLLSNRCRLDSVPKRCVNPNFVIFVKQLSKMNYYGICTRTNYGNNFRNHNRWNWFSGFNKRRLSNEFKKRNLLLLQIIVTGVNWLKGDLLDSLGGGKNERLTDDFYIKFVNRMTFFYFRNCIDKILHWFDNMKNLY